MEVLDLLAFAGRMPEHQRRLRGLIESVSELNSARTDLRLAADMANVALDLVRREEPLADSEKDTLLALLSSTIVYYARATKSGSDHRRTYQLRNHFSTAEIATHDLLCRLRDDAIAHFGPGKLADGTTLRSDFLCVAESGRLMAVSRSTYATDELVARLAVQTNTALLLMQRRYHEQETELARALDEATHDPELLKLRDECVTDIASLTGHDIANQVEDREGVDHLRF